MSEDEPKVGRRAAPRLRLSLPGVLVGTLGNYNCIVTNISRTGALVAINEPLKVGEQAYLRCGMLNHFVIVIRQDRGLNAIEFDNPLDDALVLELRRFHESFEQHERDDLMGTARSWIIGENSGRW